MIAKITSTVYSQYASALKNFADSVVDKSLSLGERIKKVAQAILQLIWLDRLFFSKKDIKAAPILLEKVKEKPPLEKPPEPIAKPVEKKEIVVPKQRNLFKLALAVAAAISVILTVLIVQHHMNAPNQQILPRPIVDNNLSFAGPNPFDITWRRSPIDLDLDRELQFQSSAVNLSLATCPPIYKAMQSEAITISEHQTVSKNAANKSQDFCKRSIASIIILPNSICSFNPLPISEARVLPTKANNTCAINETTTPPSSYLWAVVPTLIPIIGCCLLSRKKAKPIVKVEIVDRSSVKSQPSPFETPAKINLKTIQSLEADNLALRTELERAKIPTPTKGNLQRTVEQLQEENAKLQAQVADLGKTTQFLAEQVQDGSKAVIRNILLENQERTRLKNNFLRFDMTVEERKIDAEVAAINRNNMGFDVAGRVLTPPRPILRPNVPQTDAPGRVQPRQVKEKVGEKENLAPKIPSQPKKTSKSKIPIRRQSSLGSLDAGRNRVTT